VGLPGGRGGAAAGGRGGTLTNGTLVKRPSSCKTASNILLDVTVCWSYSCRRVLLLLCEHTIHNFYRVSIRIFMPYSSFQNVIYFSKQWPFSNR
jgi:hypothetical protein